MSKLLGQRTTSNFDEWSDVKAYFIELVKDRDDKVVGKIAQLSERLYTVEDGRMKDLQCVTFNQTNDLIRRMQEFEGKMGKYFTKLRHSAFDSVNRSDFEELATTQEREINTCVENFEGKVKALKAGIDNLKVKVRKLSAGVQLAEEKHAQEEEDFDKKIERLRQDYENHKRELTMKLTQLDLNLAIQVNDAKQDVEGRVTGILEDRFEIERSYRSKQLSEDSFLTENARTVEIYESQAHRLSLIENKLDEISNRIEDIEIRTLRLDIDDIIQKRDQDKDEFSEALATFGKQEEFRDKKGKSSPELVTMSLNDLGESDVESNGLMSPTLSPLNRFEQAVPMLAARLKKFVFDDQHSLIEEALNEEEPPSPDNSMKLPKNTKTIGMLSDRLMIHLGGKYTSPVDSERQDSFDSPGLRQQTED